MSKLTKNQKAVLAKYDKTKVYPVSEACALLKEITYTKFDASVEITTNLGVDPRKANQMIRGVVTLPAGTGKVTRVLVLCTPTRKPRLRKPVQTMWSGRLYPEDQRRLDRRGCDHLHPFRDGKGWPDRPYPGSPAASCLTPRPAP
jgi:LSU ribosomal protein L1P